MEWMKISLANAGRRFNREWIFRRATMEFHTAQAYAITGANGSGKSTLLQCISTMLQLSEGSIQFTQQGKQVEPEKAFQFISFCAPYLDIIEEMTLTEFLQFHTAFKPLISGTHIKEIIETIGLKAAADKQIRHFSSGMKQRVKLAQAIFSDTPILLLDEPCSNLDSTGIALYHSLIQHFGKQRLIIVCSNDEVEYSFCKERIAISDFKPATS
jgi:ABC-type multidrug transport system ATPase subunit